MTSKTTNKFLPQVRTRAVRMVLDHETEPPHGCIRNGVLFLDLLRIAGVDRNLNEVAYLDVSDRVAKRGVDDPAFSCAQNSAISPHLVDADPAFRVDDWTCHAKGHV